MELKKDAESSDLAGVYTDIADIIGVELAYKLYQYFGGQQIALSHRFYDRTYIKKCVQKEYTGKNIGELCRKYGYSESSIRLMLKSSGKYDKDKTGKEHRRE